MTEAFKRDPLTDKRFRGNFMEAQQTAGIIVLPFAALVVVQITGIITRTGPRFNREQIISTL